MDVLVVARTLIRRWYVILPVLMLTAVAVYAVSQQSSPTYTATGTFIIADPTLQSPEERDEAQVSAVDVASPQIIAQVMQDAEVHERISAAGGTGSYRIGTPTDEGVITVSAVGESEGNAVDTVDLLLDELVAQVEERQDAAAIPDADRFGVEVLSRPAAAQEVAAPDEAAGTAYEATGSARISGRYGTENPYSRGSFTFQVLYELASSAQGRAELAEAGAAADWELEQDDAVVHLTITGHDPDAVTSTYSVLVGWLGEELENRQAALGIPGPERTRLDTLAAPSGAVEEPADIRRPLITLAGLGLVAGVGLALLFDNLATSLAVQRAVRQPWNASDEAIEGSRMPPPTGAKVPSSRATD